MSLYSRLRKREAEGSIINVAVSGAGLIGRGIARQIDLTPGMRTAMIINRRPERAIEAYVASDLHPDDIVVSTNRRELQQAILTNRPTVSTRTEVLQELEVIDVAVEVTGAVEYGAQMALHAFAGGKHVVMMNAETDATVGCILKQKADEAGLIYTNSDGDQPGVLKRMIDYVEGIGFEIVAAVNCKGFLDRYATPDSIRPWAEKQSTSLPMTTAFTDGTKMNIENAVISNATGLVPEVRGMHGVETELGTALMDCLNTFRQHGIVDYTLGGDFHGGVFVIGYGVDEVMIQPYMKYLKMGDGPYYLFYRPYHLCHMETPLSIAEAVLDHEPTIAPKGPPVVDVIATAKSDLTAGDTLDGIGGYTAYGVIETAEHARGLLPIGISEGARLTRDIMKDDPIPVDAVSLPQNRPLINLRHQQDSMSQVRVA